MRNSPYVRPHLAAPQLLGFFLLCFAANAETAAQTSVTTTWLRDPFPNTPPKALDRHMSVEADTPRRTPSVLLGVYDVENDPLKVSAFTQPKHGAAALNADGTFLYTPLAGYTGEDAFTFTLDDGRGGTSTATMHITVFHPTGKWATASFTNMIELQAGGQPIVHKNTPVVPRLVDWDNDGRQDLLLGASGAVWFYRNVGTATEFKFAAGEKIKAAGVELDFGRNRVSLACVDMDRDGKLDLVVVAGGRVRYFHNENRGAGAPVLAGEVILKGRGGEDFVAPDARADVGDWNGDGLPDLIFGTQSGDVKIAYNIGTAARPVLDTPTTALDADGRTLNGSYNLNVRWADVNQDGLLDIVDTFNWGTMEFRLNTGTAKQPRIPEIGQLNVSGPNYAALNFHALTDGPIIDFGDLNGDGTTDMVIGGESGGPVRFAVGQSSQSYIKEIDAILAAHAQDLPEHLADAAGAATKDRLRALHAALYDYAANFATPTQKLQIGAALIAQIQRYPQYFKRRAFDTRKQPGIGSLAIQTWLTALVARYDDPPARRELADAADFTGGYRKLLEEIGLIYAENNQNPRGAEAMYEWMRTIPREVYPGNLITAKDWLGETPFLVRSHAKNTFNGAPIDNGEYGFGPDARAVIGDRGSENWFMTVVHHEVSHDLDAYVRKFPDLQRRWGQTLVLAGGPDMRANPETGWISWELTREHFKSAGFWDGNKNTWDAALKKYWSTPPGSDWNKFGFMRGNISWFYSAPQESLATQGNQFWNSTEGRVQVALDRWKRGFTSNLTEVLFFMDIWSVGLDKMKFYENDNACNQTICFVKLGRTKRGYIDRIDFGDRYYQFTVDDKGVVTGIVHAPEK